MRYTTVLFDLDGTLMNTLEDIRDSVNHVLLEKGYPERNSEQIGMALGNGARVLLAKSLPDGENTEGFDGILSEYEAYYLAHNMIKTKPYEGIHKMLRELSAREYKLAVVSNKSDANVKELVNKFFGDVVSVAIGESPKIRRKPAPDTVLEALRELGSSPWESVYVGDSEVDIKTAAAAGLDCISVAWGFRSEDFLNEAGAKYIVKTPEEILKLI